MPAAFAAGAGEPDARPKMLLNRALRLGRAASWRRCAPIRPPTASRWPARRAGWPTRSRTWTSSPRRRTRRRCCARVRRARRRRVVVLGGQRRERARTHSGLSVDLRVVEPDQFGNLLQHFTGSKAHNVALRGRRCAAGCTSGVRADRRRHGHHPCCATEEEVYALLGLPWIPQELREDRGELQLHSAADVPKLVDVGDLRGDLHSHTVASDGRHTVEEMAGRRRSAAWSTWPSPTTPGLAQASATTSRPTTCAAIEHVREVNAGLDGFELLVGTETNIGLDGAPDYDDDLLAELSLICIGSVHTSFGMDSEAMTRRMVAAVEHPLSSAIGHPPGARSRRGRPMPSTWTRSSTRPPARGR